MDIRNGLDIGLRDIGHWFRITLGISASIELFCMGSTRCVYACMTNDHVRGEVTGKRKLKSEPTRLSS
jgi:hypothetical protein